MAQWQRSGFGSNDGETSAAAARMAARGVHTDGLAGVKVQVPGPEEEAARDRLAAWLRLRDGAAGLSEGLQDVPTGHGDMSVAHTGGFVDSVVDLQSRLRAALLAVVSAAAIRIWRRGVGGACAFRVLLPAGLGVSALCGRLVTASRVSVQFLCARFCRAVRRRRSLRGNGGVSALRAVAVAWRVVVSLAGVRFGATLRPCHRLREIGGVSAPRVLLPARLVVSARYGREVHTVVHGFSTQALSLAQ